MKLLIDFFLVAGIIITGLIIYLLFKTKKKDMPRKIIIIFFVFLFLVALNTYANFHDIDWLYIITVLLEDNVIVFVGPLLYLYVKSLLNKESGFLKKNYLHFVPVLLNFFIITLPYFLSNFNLGNSSYTAFIEKNVDTIRICHNTYLIGYLFLSITTFNRYKELMKTNFSSFTEKEFLWVKNMLIGSLLVIGFDLALIFLEIAFPNSDIINSIDLTVIAMIIFIFYLGYYGINQSKVLLPEFLVKEIETGIPNSKRKDYLSGFNELELQEINNKLEHLFIEEKPYLDEDLTLNKLAQMIPTTDKKLSIILNQYMNTTFYDYINKYRVASVKEKIQSDDYKGITLLGIAYESGFKSKTSFNRIFKKETGLSPSEYKKSL